MFREVSSMLVTLDKKIEEFIERYIDSFTEWDLLVFFEKHPEVKDIPGNIAAHIGRREWEVEKSLNDLVDKGILTVERDVRPLYAYNPSLEARNLIKRFVKALNVRGERLAILAMLLNKGIKE